MEFRDGQWRKPLLLLNVTLLLAMSVGAWYADDAEKPPLVLPAARDSGEHDSTTEIIGLRQANDPERVLRNPFSWLHETEQESRSTVRDSKDSAADRQPSKTSPSAAGPPAMGNIDKQHTGSQDISLCGIVEGGGQRLALLRVGSNTVTVGEGERIADWQVTGISTAAVTVERAGQVRCLQMNAEMGAR